MARPLAMCQLDQLPGSERPVQHMKPIRIIVADDHSTWLATTLEWLTASSEFQIEACAINGAEAVELCRHLRPDVALLDISMPVMNGLEAARLIREEGTAALILLVSIHQRLNTRQPPGPPAPGSCWRSTGCGSN
jgi:CheY-like chemotaxis protein